MNPSYGQSLATLYDPSLWLLVQSPNPFRTVAQVKTFTYEVNYPFLHTQNTTDLNIDYIDCYNSLNSPFTPITRTTQYGVIGAESSTSDLPFNIMFKFEDSYSCTISGSCNITKVEASINGVGSFPITTNTTGSVTTGTFSAVVHNGDQLSITETFEFPHYETACVDECTTSDGGKMLDSKLYWGFDDVDENHATTPNLCREIQAQNQIIRGTKSPAIFVSRISPAPRVPSSDPNNPTFTSYWDADFSSPGSTLWKFKVENRGTDAVKDLTLLITEQYSKSQFYYLRPSDISFHNIPTSAGSAIFEAEAYIDIVGPHVACADNYSTGILGPIFSTQYRFDRLLPGESFEVWLNLQYCCSNNDPELFDQDKYLNAWAIIPRGYTECTGDQQFLGGTRSDFANGIYGLEGFSISKNSTNKLYLKQDFSPSVTDLDAGTTCSGPQELHVDNFNFNLDQSNNFCLENANIFTSTYSNYPTPGDPSLMLLTGSIKYVITTENGLSILPTAIDFQFRDPSGRIWPSANIIPFTGSNCVGGSTTVTYNFADFPGGNTLPNIYAFLNNSSFYFKIFGCCCATSIPKYTIETFISGATTCDIPMCRKEAEMNIHCSGCSLPGMTVTNGTHPLERRISSYGFEDGNNDGLADNQNTISSTYSEINNVQINRSMVGDDLETTISAFLDNTSSITVLQMRNRAIPIDLTHVYLEEKIEHSNSSEFDVNITDVSVSIDQGGIIYLFTLTAGDPNIHDARNTLDSNGDPNDIIFFDLSRSVVRTATGSSTFEYIGGEIFTITAHFHVCNNYVKDATSILANDNKFQSKVSINMYLKANNALDDLVGLGIFNAFSSHLRPIAQQYYVPGSNIFDINWLYYCETRSEYHYFYTVHPTIDAGILDQRDGTTCNKSLFVDHEYYNSPHC